MTLHTLALLLVAVGCAGIVWGLLAWRLRLAVAGYLVQLVGCVIGWALPNG